MTSLLVIGGARSGKSRYAEARVAACGKAFDATLAYIATAEALDDEMTARIAHHVARRGARWYTIEAPLDLTEAIETAGRASCGILVDCLTLWLSNLLHADRDPRYEGEKLMEALRSCPVPLVLVANEVGMGIVPENALARRFRDEAGWLNQWMATVADEVVMVVAGLPLVMKREGMVR